MHTITSEYKGQLRTENTHLKSGQKLITDAPTDNQGRGEAFSPTDLVCTALCSCMMTIMGIRARDENIDLEGMQANVTKIMAANPRKISKIKIVFTKTDLQATPNQLEMLKQAALTCPVALSINEDISQEVTFNFS